MTTRPSPVSPRITALEQALGAGNTGELDLFWQEIAERGAPLVEALEGDDKHYLVTFLWRDQADVRNIVVFAGPAGWDSPAENQMTRLLSTNLWYKTYRVRGDLRTTYYLSPNDPLTKLTNRAKEVGTRLLPDPLNQCRLISGRDKALSEDAESLLELPGAPVQHWITPRPAVRKGQIELHWVRSQLLDNERRVWVYTPPGYTTSSEPYDLLLLFDGMFYLERIPTPTILDNLLFEGKLPPLVAVFPDSLSQQTRNRELPCYPPLVDFLRQELLPWVHEQYRVTTDPARSIVAGSSYGGLAAAFVGLCASEIFGNVLSQSGSFWWKKDEEDHIPQEWLIQQFLASPRLPLRFYLEVGLKEISNQINMISHTRHFRDVLQLKGYEVHYAEFNGGHSYLNWRGSLADGLLALRERRS